MKLEGNSVSRELGGIACIQFSVNFLKLQFGYTLLSGV